MAGLGVLAASPLPPALARVLGAFAADWAVLPAGFLAIAFLAAVFFVTVFLAGAVFFVAVRVVRLPALPLAGDLPPDFTLRAAGAALAFVPAVFVDVFFLPTASDSPSL